MAKPIHASATNPRQVPNATADGFQFDTHFWLFHNMFCPSYCSSFCHLSDGIKVHHRCRELVIYPSILHTVLLHIAKDGPNHLMRGDLHYFESTPVYRNLDRYSVA